MPAAPSSPPEPPKRTSVTPPTVRQIWTRAIVVAAVLALFVAIAFGRFETERVVRLFILWAVPLALVLGGLFTLLNRPSSGGRSR